MSPVKCAVSHEFSEKNQKEQHTENHENSAIDPRKESKGEVEEADREKKKKPHLELVSSQDQPPKASPEGYMELVTQFEEQRKEIRRSLGTKAYQSALKNQRKSGIFRKGAMLDEDIN